MCLYFLPFNYFPCSCTIKVKFSLNFPTFWVTKIPVTLLPIQSSHFWTKCTLLREVFWCRLFSSMCQIQLTFPQNMWFLKHISKKFHARTWMGYEAHFLYNYRLHTYCYWLFALRTIVCYTGTTWLLRNIILLALVDPEEKGITVLWNVKDYLPNNTELQPRWHAHCVTCILRWPHIRRHLKTSLQRPTSPDKSLCIWC